MLAASAVQSVLSCSHARSPGVGGISELTCRQTGKDPVPGVTGGVDEAGVGVGFLGGCFHVWRHGLRPSSRSTSTGRVVSAT